MAALSRVSRHFHEITEAHLYATFEQDEVSGAAIPLFLRTLLAKPQLCRHVKRWIGNTCNYLAIEMESLGEENHEVLHFLIYYLLEGQSVDHKKWFHAAKDGSWDALAAIVLSILPNLEEVVFLDYGHPDGYPFLGAVLERAKPFQDMDQADSPVFVRLADLAGMDDFFARGIRLFRSSYGLCTLQNLQRVTLVNQMMEYFPEIGMVSPTGWSSKHSLRCMSNSIWHMPAPMMLRKDAN